MSEFALQIGILRSILGEPLDKHYPWWIPKERTFSWGKKSNHRFTVIMPSSPDGLLWEYYGLGHRYEYVVFDRVRRAAERWAAKKLIKPDDLLYVLEDSDG